MGLVVHYQRAPQPQRTPLARGSAGLRGPSPWVGRKASARCLGATAVRPASQLTPSGSAAPAPGYHQPPVPTGWPGADPGMSTAVRRPDDITPYSLPSINLGVWSSTGLYDRKDHAVV